MISVLLDYGMILDTVPTPDARISSCHPCRGSSHERGTRVLTHPVGLYRPGGSPRDCNRSSASPQHQRLAYAVAFVIVGQRAASPVLDRQSRLSSVRRLNPALFVHAQDDHRLWRIRIRTHDIGRRPCRIAGGPADGFRALRGVSVCGRLGWGGFGTGLWGDDEDGVAGFVEVEAAADFQFLLVEILFEVLEPLAPFDEPLAEIVIFFLKFANPVSILG